MDDFQTLSKKLVLYRLRSSWLELSKLFNAVAADYDGTMSMGFVLLTINEKEGTPVTRIAPRMGMEPNSLSRLLKSLEARGLVYRQRGERDKRKVYICLTEEGKEMRDVALRTVVKVERSIVKGIPPEKLQAFFEVMDQIPVGLEALRTSLQDPGSH